MPLVQFYGDLSQYIDNKILNPDGTLIHAPQPPYKTFTEAEYDEWSSLWGSLEPREGYILNFDKSTIGNAKLLHDSFPHMRLRTLQAHNLFPPEYQAGGQPDSAEIGKANTLLTERGLFYSGSFYPIETDKEHINNGAPISLDAAVVPHTERILRLAGFACTLYSIKWMYWVSAKGDPVFWLVQFRDYLTSPLKEDSTLKEDLEFVEIQTLKQEGIL